MNNILDSLSGLSSSVYFGLFLSLLAYFLGIQLKKKFKISILNPLLVSIVLVIVFLVIFNIDYEDYNKGGRYISYFLTPATVCLAIPLYQQLHLLKDNFKAVMMGILAAW